MQGKKNLYVCHCGHRFITVDRDEGATPFMVAHKTFNPNTNCNSMCRSGMYREVAEDREATHEWYAAGAEEALKYGPEGLKHAQEGGLFLRRIPGASEPYLLLSIQHSPADAKALWWRPNSQGYTFDLDSAGRYSKKEAESIADPSSGDSVAVPESDALAIGKRTFTADWAKARYEFVDKVTTTKGDLE